MTGDPLDLAGYLLARLDEAEAALLAATPCAPAPWTTVEADQGESRLIDRDGVSIGMCPDDGRNAHYMTGEAVHIAAWNPAAVLALVAAQRAIIELHRPWGGPLPDGTRDCQVCGWRLYGCLTLLALAQIHAARPDFPPAWRTP